MLRNLRQVLNPVSFDVSPVFNIFTKLNNNFSKRSRLQFKYFSNASITNHKNEACVLALILI